MRPAAYLETWLQILTKTAGASSRPLIFGRGETPIRFASAAEVSAVVTRAATDAKLRGRILDVAGESVTNDRTRPRLAGRAWLAGLAASPATTVVTRDGRRRAPDQFGLRPAESHGARDGHRNAARRCTSCRLTWLACAHTVGRAGPIRPSRRDIDMITVAPRGSSCWPPAPICCASLNQIAGRT